MRSARPWSRLAAGARSRLTRSAAMAVATCAALSVMACGNGESSPDSIPASASASPSGTPSPGVLLRATLATDSAVAVALADSLGREGWEASVTRRPDADGRWPVHVLVIGDSAVAAVTVKAMRDAGFDPAVIGSRPSRRGLAVSVARVNRGTHGMSARVRWALRADRKAILVVEDPRSIENEPLPNGFLFAVEGGPPAQRDSVWDVMPSPDWRRVAYTRAYTTRAGESDSITPREWRRLAQRVELMDSTVRKHAFPTSAMVAAFGAARPFIIDASTIADTVVFPEASLPIAEGWRVGWSADGTALGIGAPPEIMGDDAPASRWRLVDPATAADRGAVAAASVARLTLTEGPSLNVAITDEMKQRRAFRSGDVDVESEDGWIRVYARAGARLRAPTVVGPGIALTATANGEFVVAIAADPDARSYDPPNHLVVYHIRRR